MKQTKLIVLQYFASKNEHVVNFNFVHFTKLSNTKDWGGMVGGPFIAWGSIGLN